MPVDFRVAISDDAPSFGCRRHLVGRLALALETRSLALHRVRELVRDQRPASRSRGRVPTATEVDLMPASECRRTQARRQSIRLVVAVDPNVCEPPAKCCLERNTRL
jgi:hypothetical protein